MAKSRPPIRAGIEIQLVLFEGFCARYYAIDIAQTKILKWNGSI